MGMMSGFPDLLRTARLATLQTQAKQGLADANYEVTTGLAHDQIAATKGDPMKLFGLQARLATLESREPLVNVAKTRAMATATALDNINKQLDTLGPELTSFAETGDISSSYKIARAAKMALNQVMSALSGSVGSRLLFSGEKTGTAPLASAETLLQDVSKALATPPKATIYVPPAVPPAPPPPPVPPNTWASAFITNYELPDAETNPGAINPRMDQLVARQIKVATEQLNIYYGDAPAPDDPATLPPNPGPVAKTVLTDDKLFDKHIYKGGSKSPPKVELGDDDHLDYTIKANDKALKNVMRFLSMAAQIEKMPAPATLTDDELRTVNGYPISTDPAEEAKNAAAFAKAKPEIVAKYARDVKFELYKTAAQGLIQAKDQLTELRADLGLSQKRIDEAITANKAENTTLQTVRTDIIGVDAYTAATRVKEMESQLQAIYMVTARTARLSFLDYMR